MGPSYIKDGAARALPVDLRRANAQGHGIAQKLTDQRRHMS
jgi:hypothetical protein